MTCRCDAGRCLSFKEEHREGRTQRTVEAPRVQYIDRIVNVPVMMKRRVRMTQQCRRSWHFHRSSTLKRSSTA